MSSSRITTSHQEIRQWAKERGCRPAVVKEREPSPDEPVNLRLRCDPVDYLEDISWEDFFKIFESSDLAFFYQDEPQGFVSNFHEFVHRATAHRLGAWLSAMRRGDFRHAWAISDTILRDIAAQDASRQPPRQLRQVWTGTPLEGKQVLVRSHHGLGDAIQFIRLAERLRQVASKVIVCTDPRLATLIATAPGVDQVLPMSDGPVDADYDVEIELMELGHALRVTLSDLPGRVPYLFPKSLSRIAPDQEHTRVGLVWRSSEWDVRRSVPADLLAPLWAIPGFRWFSLQRGPARRDAAILPLEDISSDDVNVTAATLRDLDLIITVDTMVAHLAGAIGAPVWTLLHANCDWRWMDERPDCPWYPTMQLFRQQRIGDWRTVIDDVATALRNVRRPPDGPRPTQSMTNASSTSHPT